MTPVQQYARTLAAFSEDQWLAYVMQREPLSGRLSPERQKELYHGALDCGREQAVILRRGHDDASIADLVAATGVEVYLDDIQSDGVFTTFATYSEKQGIRIYVDNARATDELIQREGLTDLSGGVKTEDLLLSHELFHVVEGNTPDLFTEQKHVELFRLGPLVRRSKVLCLCEVAAMAFAKELTGLPCNPYVFDIVMLYAKNPQRARQQYEQIVRICGKTEEQ